jgi:serine/threonine protein kinase
MGLKSDPACKTDLPTLEFTWVAQWLRKKQIMDLILAPGETILESYRLTKFLGRGGAGEVWEAIGPGDIPKAVKVARFDPDDADLAQRELDGLRRMRAIRHPFILSIERYEVQGGQLIVVMELADSSLEQRHTACVKSGEKGIPRAELVKYIREAAEALDYLRTKHGLQHLDVKPANLFLSAGHVKLADFGLVHAYGTQLPATALALSPFYAPPELFDGSVTETADQYSLAVTYQETLTGTKPFPAQDLRNLLAALMRGKPELSALPVTDRLIVQQAIDRDSTRRFKSCTEFADRLKKVSTFAAIDRKPASTQRISGGKPATPESATRSGSLPAQRQPAVTERLPKQDTVRPGLEAPTVAIGNERRIVETFIAYIPLQIYAHKLRGFIDELGAEVMSCSDERARMRFCRRNWLGRRNPKDAIHLTMDALSHTPTSGYRVIEATATCDAATLDENTFRRRAHTLFKLLRSYLIAADKNHVIRVSAAAKAEILS